MLWYQGTQNIGLSNRKLKSALMCCMITMHAPPTDRRTDRQTDEQTDEHHGNSATIRSMNAPNAKKDRLLNC